MKSKLWRLSFEPVYPVCTGELIFTTLCDVQDADARAMGEEIIKSYGISKSESFSYLGEFNSSLSFHMSAERKAMEDVYIVTIQTGDY